MPQIASCVFFICFFITSQALALIDDSVSIFFPKELKTLEKTQTQFSFFWWNFIVIEPLPASLTPNKTLAETVCQKMNAVYSKQISNIICAGRYDSFLPQLKEWAVDYPRRTTYNSQANDRKIFQQKAAQVLLQASMISDPTMLDLFRHDPFSEWKGLLQQMQMQSPQAFQLQQGFLVDQPTGRIVIPVQFNMPPKRANVEILMQDLYSIGDLHIIGAHASSYTNEKQIMDDLNIVSLVGIISLIVFAIFLILKRRYNIIFLYIPVFVAVGLATLVTELIYGRIHGLTLAFGSGIIGLVLDYGLHGAFNIHSKQTWKSNSVGLITTLIGLSGLLFCSIPLIQQMMVFSISGLGLGYLIFYYLCHFHTKYFSIEGLLIQIPHRKIFVVIALLFSSFCIFLSQKISWTMDLKAMNFYQPGELKIAEWLYKKTDLGEMLISTLPSANAETTEATENILQDELQFATQKNFRYQGIAKYLPTKNQQQANLHTWAQNFCPNFLIDHGKDLQKFFQPFWTANCQPQQNRLEKTPSYLQQFENKNEILSVFFAQDPAQKKEIQSKFPSFQSLPDHLRQYSLIFEKDLQRIIPIAFLVCLLLLYLYYRKIQFVLSAIIPFLCGTGLYFSYQVFSQQQIDLMGLVGLIMVFCFSLDYGIFATDIVAFPQAKENAIEIRSSLTFAAISNLLGYLPMVFAHHVVLHNLGMALFLGTLGTYVGCIWGASAVASFQFQKKSVAT